MATIKPPACSEAAALAPRSRQLTSAETLVGLGFRRGFTALATRDDTNWEFAWQSFANVTGPGQATVLVADLAHWCRAVKKCAGRRIEIYPAGCPGFCRDECLAISMIAASQQGVCPALRACAFALLASNELEQPLQTALQFGECLARAGQRLLPDTLCDGLLTMPEASRRLS